MSNCMNDCGNDATGRGKYCSDKCKVSYNGNRNKSDASKVNAASGYIYIIQSGNTDFYKIGQTRNRPMSRLRELQTGSPIKLTLYEVCYVPDMEIAESVAHTRYAANRGIGEWFTMTQAELDELVDTLVDDNEYCYYKDYDAYDAREYGLLRVGDTLSGGLDYDGVCNDPKYDDRRITQTANNVAVMAAPVVKRPTLSPFPANEVVKPDYLVLLRKVFGSSSEAYAQAAPVVAGQPNGKGRRLSA